MGIGKCVCVCVCVCVCENQDSGIVGASDQSGASKLVFCAQI